jgi:hypothetical protein
LVENRQPTLPASQRKRSPSYGGRSVFGWEMPKAARAGGRGDS